jgi:hypothetical protein
MEFTFGIITHGNSENICEVLNSITRMNIPKDKFEIIVVGGESNFINKIKKSNNSLKEVNHVIFDEGSGDVSVSGMITKKKNMITSLAKFENIVYTHDYYVFDTSWYDGYKKFGNNWDVCMNYIFNKNGDRFRDWTAWDDPDICFHRVNGKPKHSVIVVPHSYSNYSYMYVSGGYWVAKKKFMEEFPLDETLVQNQSEDVEWSKRWLKENKFKYRMNTLSLNTLLKDKRLSAFYSFDGSQNISASPGLWTYSDISCKIWEAL